MNSNHKTPFNPPKGQDKFWHRYGLLLKSLVISLLILIILQSTLLA